MTDLLERDGPLATLAASALAAAGGRGSTVLVSGEAGIGKTTLLERFEASLAPGRVLWGGCESLSTPRPLGPLHDIAAQSAGRLRALLATTHDRVALFAAVLDELSNAAGPTVLVLEDVHWADEATLDLVKFVGRRIHRLPALLVLSYRDDVASLGTLRAVLGELPSAHLVRIALPRLSRAAVEGLAARSSQLDGAGIYEATSGNPFFVTEILRQGSALSGVPATVRDAVLGRADPLPLKAREVLQLAAIVPRQIELALVDAVLAPATEDVEACVLGGLLLAEGRTLRFRHELARTTIEESILPPRATLLHARVLAALAARPLGTVPLAQLAHHAQRAGDIEAVLRWAPQAASEAGLRGARREAVAHLRAALAHADRLDDATHASLLDAFATHSFELNDMAVAIPAREAAITLFARLGDVARESDSHARRAVALVRALRNGDADAASRRAIALVENLAPGRELARAAATESYLRMLNRDYEEAVAWGEQAIALAERLDDPVTLAGACNSVGAALMFVDYPRGCEHVLKSMEIARGLGDGGAAVADAYVMIGTASGEVGEFAVAERYLDEGIAFARSRDLDRLAGYMEGWQALCDMYRGRWSLAGERANAAAAREAAGTTNRIVALVALGRLRTRRGDPGTAAVLDEALDLAARTGTLQRLAPVSAARAEAAWIEGRDDDVVAEVERSFALAAKKRHPWFLGELAFWLWRVGRLSAPPAGCAEPYHLQMAGRWQDAADAWATRGCPYERARALADGDEAAQRSALAILDALGAAPLAGHVRDRMRRAGVRSIPRGTLVSTRANAAGLTTRELQVLALVAEGRRNVEIAASLSRSSRTVDHHVESILAKLEVGSRADAVAAARRMGLLAKNG
jgi:DNA-binding CsgD family transcriptional regulator/tetratricopeptide (TPR) repeat protein